MEIEDFTLDHVKRTMSRKRYAKYRRAYRQAVGRILTKAILSGVTGSYWGATMIESTGGINAKI